MRAIGLPQERDPGLPGVSENQRTVQLSQPQPRRAIRDRAAFAAPAAVVTTGAGAGVAGQPARQPPLLEEADLLQADDVGVEAGDRRRTGAGPQRPAVAPVPPQAGAHVEGSDAQRGRWTRSPASLRVALGAGAHVGKWLRQKVVSPSLLSRTCRGGSPLRSASISNAASSAAVGLRVTRPLRST